MAPVIRISDGVFRKLQLLSEPLVDTPNSVIERLLDRFGENTHQPAEIKRSPVAAPTVHPTPGIFLAPASDENLKTTIVRSVSLDSLEGKLDDVAINKLKLLLAGRRSFHCWAMTTSSRGTYDNMQVGDLVLFTPRGTGRFTFRATVTGKIESQPLGDLLWHVTPGRPWSLVYVLDDVTRVNLNKEKLISEFGYDRAFPVYGITRVASERIDSAVARRGDLERVFAAAAASS